jgi:hypothetical protein
MLIDKPHEIFLRTELGTHRKMPIINTHTHKYIYIYIYIVCVCVRACVRVYH